jgi:hypothetical protein
MSVYASAPAVGILDSSNNLTFSWTPYPDGSGLFSQYDHWVITVDSTPYTVQRVPLTGNLSTQTFTQILNSGSHAITMQGFNSSSVAVTDPWETNNVPTARTFPAVFAPSSVALSLASVLLGQTLTLTLSSLYAGADQWQVLWPDNTATGWLPLSAGVVAKSFSVPGAQNIVVQVRKDYSGNQYVPPASLIRQIAQQIFVIDQQAPGTTPTTGGLTGDLGIGGQQGFEIVDASSPTAVPNPWEIIARAFVRDTITNELKLLVATTRFSNASSLLGTMAIDVFPVEGRPHSLELIVPVYELTTTSATGSVPVKIQTSTLPNLIVGKSISQALGGTLALTVKSGTGIQPFLWTATELPAGVSMSSSGVINGIPLELGAFTPTFAVQDSSIPFSIDEATLNVTVITDLLVQIATGQTDAKGNALAPLGTTFGIAQVGTPYTVQMQVGNINASAATAGGLPPYQWSIPAGALPIGLSIDPNTGIISGRPCTYNSTTDYSLTYTAVVQVTDAIGAKATQTYTMSLIAAALQFGPIDQSLIFSLQEFNLDVPVFGGQSPYNSLVFTAPPSDGSYYGTVALIDGRVEVPVSSGGFPTTSIGGHQFVLSVSDSSSPTKTTGNVSVNFQVGVPSATPPIGEISDIRIVQADPEHYWDYADSTAKTLPIRGNLTGYTLQGGTLSPDLSNGIVLAIDATVPQVDATGPATTYNNAQLRIPLVLTQSGQAFGSVSREYTFSAHNDKASTGDIGTFTAYPRPYIIGDAVGLNPRKPYFNSTATVPASLAGSVSPPEPLLTARVQSGSSLPPGLSLDANTGLIYGTLVGLSTGSSIVEYTDAGGTIHGTITINWATYQSTFQSTNPGNSVAGSMGVAATLTLFTAPSGITLANPMIIYPLSNNVAYGVPGLLLGLDVTNTMVRLTGTPTEAGYFDIWLQVQGNNASQVSYVYQRVVIGYAKPMIILTSSLPDISAAPLTTQFPSNGITLQGFGGVPPYAWSSPQFPSGSGAAPIVGLTLATNTGIIAGTLSSPPGSSPTPLFTVGSPITFTLTDSRGATVSKNFSWNYNNIMRITTTVIPTIVDLTVYGFAMSALGGTGIGYTWSIGTGSPTAALPTGISFSSSGVFSGTALVPSPPTPYSSSFPITVTDSAANTWTGLYPSGALFLIQTGPAVLNIDQSKVGVIDRGVPYQGTLTLENGTSNYVPPIQWQVAPSGNAILSGLAFQADGATQGVNAIVGGTYSGTPYQPYSIAKITGSGATVTVTTQDAIGFVATNTVVISGTVNFNGAHAVASVAGDYSSFTYSSSVVGTETTGTATVATDLYPIQVLAVDSIGQSAFLAPVYLNTGTDLIIATTSLPNAIVSGSYNCTLAASGGVPPYTWMVDPTSVPSSLPASLSLNSSTGAITGPAGTIFSDSIIFRVTDSLSGIPNFARATLSLTSQATGLTITTTSITPAISGQAYTFALAASGSANTPYTWSIDSGSLPTGLSLSTSANQGIISGTSTAVGSSQSITFRVTDSIGAYATKALTVSVGSALTLYSGIDYEDSISTGILGYIDQGQVSSINPRPNLSFYVVATGVQSTSPAQMSVSTGNANITGAVASLGGGIAQISLTGTGFAAGSLGSNPLSVSVTDSGTTVTGTFTWVVYNDGTLRIGATLPTQLTTP